MCVSWLACKDRILGSENQTYKRNQTLDEYLKTQGQTAFEGHSTQLTDEPEFLKNIVKNNNIKHVMEIGFNAGHSSDIFLSNNKNIHVTSFDIGEHAYVQHSKKYIDTTYPGRHELIIGDSTKTIPNYIKNNKHKKFDIIFIDGGHDYNIAKADLMNCRHLAKSSKSIVIMDDTTFPNNKECEWNVGPNRAWKEAKDAGIVKELGSSNEQPCRGYSYGKYSNI
tara:strand:- start:696 stop:1364 length:669 start_codon:yes stop_codon:yes gene_type:complete